MAKADLTKQPHPLRLLFIYSLSEQVTTLLYLDLVFRLYGVSVIDVSVVGVSESSGINSGHGSNVVKWAS